MGEPVRGRTGRVDVIAWNTGEPHAAGRVGELARFIRGLPGRVGRRLRRYCRRWFQHRNHVYVRRGPFPPEHRTDCTFERFDRFEDVPRHVREAIVFHGGSRALEADEREMADHAVMWVAIVDEEPGGMLFSRRGRLFSRWFVQLEDEDIVIFRVRTYPRFRGRGIAPSLMCHAMSELLAEGGSAWIDCRIYNKPSIRSIEKAGFDRVGTMRPMSRGSMLWAAAPSEEPTEQLAESVDKADVMTERGG